MRSHRKRVEQKESSVHPASSLANVGTTETPKTKKPKGPPPEPKEPTMPPSLHIYADKDVVKEILEGYKTNKDFASLIARTTKEPQDMRKHRAYRLSNNGLLYFEDTDHKVRLCIPATERLNLIKEVHDSAHE